MKLSLGSIDFNVFEKLRFLCSFRFECLVSLLRYFYIVELYKCPSFEKHQKKKKSGSMLIFFFFSFSGDQRGRCSVDRTDCISWHGLCQTSHLSLPESGLSTEKGV